jgi:hypothetical protein
MLVSRETTKSPLRLILLYLLNEVQACEYYGSLNIRQFCVFMDDDDLAAFVVAHHQRLPLPDQARILAIAQDYRDRML